MKCNAIKYGGENYIKIKDIILLLTDKDCIIEDLIESLRENMNE